MPMARYVNFAPFIMAAEGISKNALSSQISTIKQEIRDDFPDTAIHEINELVDQLLVKYKIQRAVFSLTDDLATQTFMPLAEQQMLKVFLKKELERSDLKKCNKTYQISQTKEVISPAENPPLTQIVKHLEHSLQRFLNIQRNGKKYLEAKHYLIAAGAEKVDLNKDFRMTASFADFGTIRIKPLEPYKRKTKAWLKEEKAKIMAAEKETERKLFASPLFGRIIPYEMLWLIGHSDHALTASAICRIMRGQAGVSDWYREAEENFRKHCHNDILYSMITEEDLKKCLHALYDAHLLSSRLVHGEYTCFDVYQLTKQGESFVSLMEEKGFKRGEYAALNRLIRQTATQNLKSQLKAFSYLTDHIPLIGAHPSFMISCIQSCADRSGIS